MTASITSVQELAGMLQPYLAPVSFEKGVCIFRQDDPADCFYLITDGVVAIQLEGEDLDSEAVIGYVGKDEILGELALLDRKSRSASAYTQSHVSAQRFDFACQGKMRAERPELMIHLLSCLGQAAAIKLRQANQRLSHTFLSERDPEVEELVAAAKEAHPQLLDWPEERIDALLYAVAEAFAQRADLFADQTVKITRMGNVPDKATKNRMASRGVYRYLAGRQGFGLAEANDAGVSEFAAPAGVVFGLVPVTNPAATAIFKTLISLKSRNALILSFHRSAQPLADLFGGLIQSTLVAHGAPRHLVQWVRTRNSRRKTELFFEHSGVALILATGGKSMVRAAYSSGRPALGVGPGNAPALICSDADVEHAAQSVVISKSFDNGLICGAEQNLVATESVFLSFLQALEQAGAAVLREHEEASFREAFYDAKTRHLRHRATGKSAQELAALAGIERANPIKLLVVPLGSLDPEDGMAREKMAPVTSLFRVKTDAEGIELARAILELEGKGHTAVIHCRNRALVDQFAREMPASRILVNSPATQGVIGFTSGLIPSLTLGCGFYGGNSTGDNVTFTHLQNRKRVAFYAPPRENI